MSNDPSSDKFEVFDRNAEVRISERNLPHWFQPGAATFVTFRTLDSMPKAALDLLSNKLRLFLKSQNIDETVELSAAFEQLPPSARRLFVRCRDSSYLKILDKGFGECVLRQPQLSAIVADTLHFYNGQNYHMDRFVVMPNHVHLLAAFDKDYEMRHSLENILHYSAFRINKTLGRSRAFWQPEPFDHCVRNESQFNWIQRYIKDNPKKARLSPHCYHYWERNTYSKLLVCYFLD